MCVAETQTDCPQNLLTLTMEQIDKVIEKKMEIMLADKMNTLSEKINTLQQMIDNCSTVTLNQTKIVDDMMQEEREAVVGLEEHVERLLAKENEREAEKKETRIVHGLVKTFNSKLSESEVKNENAIREINKEVESIKVNVRTMLEEVPQVNSIEERFSSIEEAISTFGESKESGGRVNCSQSYSETIPIIASQSVVSNTNIDGLPLGPDNNIGDCLSLQSITNELCDRKTRETNFVIHNLPETTNEDQDAESVKEIVEEIMQQNCTHGLEKDTLTNKPRIYRMGRQEDGRRRTIKVHLRSGALRDSIVSNSIRLSSSEKYKSVVVQRDMTVLERKCLKELVIEKKKRNEVAKAMNQKPDWTIRKGILLRGFAPNTCRC